MAILTYRPTSEYNSVLGAVAAVLRPASAPSRQDFLVREEFSLGIRQVEVWFRTKGCHYFWRGGCTMCNYGYSTDDPDVVTHVQKAFAACRLDESTNFLVSPSGSFLDDWEVPAAARVQILKQIAALPWRTFAFESQARFITDEALGSVKAALGSRPVRVAIGLESADARVRRFSINKDQSWSEFVGSVERVTRLGFKTSVNIVLGAPFLSPRRQLEDTARTLATLDQLGADEMFLFPINVKAGTVVEWLWRHGYYQPPSLWALVQVLIDASESARERISFAWHKPYYTGTPASQKVFRRPAEGDDDGGEGLMLSQRLDDFLRTREVRPLVEIVASSKGYHRWRASLDEVPAGPSIDVIVSEMIDDVLGESWRVRHSADVETTLATYRSLDAEWR